ncbi:synaptic vesicle 2-related protein [Aplysia californica]|uniref:Synaptic vesicle 2-related protein n=1 Tax=Aplysia californica TaxID=6500 RepID=A0ABM1AAU5_APLCA|nr:synaptic vesicle 2-related protein [Aplysia californica]
MEMMLLSILGPVLHCEWFITSWEQAFLTTLVMLGMAMSSSFWGTMCDKYGRKAILLFGSILAGYFGLLTAVSPMYIWICINRFLVGLAIGICPQSLTLYSEFLPTKSRALCMVCVEVFFAFGTAFEVVIAKLIMPTLGWRYLLGATAIPILLFPCLGYWLPESARYYLACGQRDKAQAVLNNISKGNRAQLPPGELGSLDHTVEKRGEIKDLFAKKYRAVSIILFASWFSVGFCYFGIALLVPTLFTNPDGCHGSDVSTSDKDECHVECVAFTQEDYDELVITGFADFPGLLFIVAVMTCLGRRHSVALCSLLFTIFLLLSNLCVNRITLTFFLFTARAVITGVYQGIYVYTSEVYPTHIRSLGMGFGSGLSRIGALLTPYLAQVGTEKNAYIGINGYVLFGIITICLVLALPIETKGRSMQDTEEYTELDN